RDRGDADPGCPVLEPRARGVAAGAGTGPGEDRPHGDRAGRRLRAGAGCGPARGRDPAVKRLFGTDGIRGLAGEYPLHELAVERMVLDGREETGGSPGAAAPAAAASGPQSLQSADLAARYLAWLQGAVDPGASLSGWRIVLDCANGAASELGPELYRRLGATVTAVNARPDGRNINEDCGALHPEGLAQEVLRQK